MCMPHPGGLAHLVCTPMRLCLQIVTTALYVVMFLAYLVLIGLVVIKCAVQLPPAARSHQSARLVT